MSAGVLLNDMQVPVFRVLASGRARECPSAVFPFDGIDRPVSAYGAHSVYNVCDDSLYLFVAAQDSLSDVLTQGLVVVV